MDAFTEKILARARDRQRMLQGGENVAPLKEYTKGTVSEPNLTSIQKTVLKGGTSECNITAGRDNISQGHFTTTRICSDFEGQQTKTLNIQRDDFNMQIKMNSADNVRLEVEIQEQDEDGVQRNEEIGGLREESRNRLKRLGKLYAGGEEADISSPIHRTEAKFYQSIQDAKEEGEGLRKEEKCKKGLSKLADLAASINNWEDDLKHPARLNEKPSSPRKAWKPPAPQPPTQKQLSSPNKLSPTTPQKGNSPSPRKALFHSAIHFGDVNSVGSTEGQLKSASARNQSPKVAAHSNGAAEASAVDDTNSRATPKKVNNWDRKVLDSLESQGFTRTPSSSQLIYSFNSQNGYREPNQSRSDIQNAIVPEDTLKTPEKSKKIELMEKESHRKPLIEQQENPRTPESPSNKFRSGAIGNKVAMFEQKAHESPVKTKDPALLSLAERKALFEKNKGDALVPKAAFGMSAPVKMDTTMKACESKFIGILSKNKENLIQEQKNANKLSKTKGPAPPPPFPEVKIITPPTSKVTPKVTASSSNDVHRSGGIASKMAALLENKNKSTISEEQIFNKMQEERKKELDMLLNRFNKNKTASEANAIEEVYSDTEHESESDDERTAMIKKKPVVIASSQNSVKSAEKRKSGSKLSVDADSLNVVSVLEDVKRIKVSPPKAGRLYPNLSDIEATTTDPETRTPTPNEENSYEDNPYDSDDPNTSFGRDILQEVCQNITPTRKVTYKHSPSSTDNSSVMDELDEILEEMEDDSCSTGPTPPKQHKKPQTSNSFHYKSFTSTSSISPSQRSNFQSPKKSGISPRQSTELPLVVDGDHVMTLTHTVSFYRQQQNKVQTPVRQIVRHPMIEEVTEDPVRDDEVQIKIKKLQEEVNKQQNIISQTSQALNLCSSTPEFSGSTEQVEAEKVLLVATHRRQAALHELQRLKVEGTIRPLSQHSRNVPLEKGTLTISNIILPMKQKYVTALAAAGGKGHHVVCLIKCGEQVVPTKLVSTVASSSKNPDVDLYVPGSVVLNNIYSDFTVTFEVYCLQAQEECLPHEVKYHINKKSSKGLATPKKNKQDSRLVRPPKESPAGPQAVRTSSFAPMGYVVFSVQAVNKKVWSLNNTPPMSPLEGNVEMKINCELAVSVEHKAFLTMFEDVSGFGAWHRRWCSLKGHTLSYWKYPEDEKKITPIDTIDLKNCITKHVGPVSREICARLHTFLLERERPAYPEDRDTLVVVRKGDKTIIRHLLSADTKEERIEWCNKLNAALTALRMWGNNQN